MRTLAAVARLPSFLRDPWEYDFDKLGSLGSRSSGPAQWSAKAEAILNGRINLAGALVLADTPAQVPWLKAKILERDAADAGAPSSRASPPRTTSCPVRRSSRPHGSPCSIASGTASRPACSRASPRKRRRISARCRPPRRSMRSGSPTSRHS